MGTDKAGTSGMAPEPCIRFSGNTLLVDCKVQPGASNSALMDVQEGRLRVRIAAAPENGKANNELRAFFAGLLGCPKRDVVLRNGEKSRLKTLALPGSYAEKLRARIRERGTR